MLVNSEFITNDGSIFKIAEYINSTRIKVIFDNGFEKYTSKKQILNGQLKNEMKPTVYGVGYIGFGEYKSKYNGEMDEAYTAWVEMLRRCYSMNKSPNNKNYINCKVDEEWHNFQNFAKWYYDNKISDQFKTSLDKDILIKGNKLYSKNTCCIVPKQINTLVITSKGARGDHPIGVSKSSKSDKFVARLNKFGKNIIIGYFENEYLAFLAYKREKESHVKNVAEMYKEHISSQCYNALINFKVEIND